MLEQMTQIFYQKHNKVRITKLFLEKSAIDLKYNDNVNSSKISKALFTTGTDGKNDYQNGVLV